MRQPPKSATHTSQTTPHSHNGAGRGGRGSPTSQLSQSHGQGQEKRQEKQSVLHFSVHTYRLGVALSQMLIYYKLHALSLK